jgi:hypothetical protein
MQLDATHTQETIMTTTSNETTYKTPATAESAYAQGYNNTAWQLCEDKPELDKLGGYQNDDWDEGVINAGHDIAAERLGWDGESYLYGSDYTRGALAAVEDYRKVNWPTYEELYTEIHAADLALAPGNETPLLGYFNAALSAKGRDSDSQHAPDDLVEYWRAAYAQWEDWDGDDIRDFFDSVAFSLY